MGLMTFMRTKMGYFLVGGIAVVLALFVLEPLLQHTSSLWGASRTSVGSIDGEEIKYEEFNPKVEQSVAQFKQQYGGSINPQMQAMAVDNAWQAEVANVLLTKEYTRLGLIVSGDELFDLLQGKNPSPLIKQYFSNPQTGELDRTAVITSLKAQQKDPKLKQQWDMLQAEIEKQALQQKYANLVRNSVYVTSLEANDEYINRNKLVNFKYVNLDYSAVLDKDVKITDADYQAYYDANKKRFDNPVETRSFEYVSFSIKPTATDSAGVKAQVEKLAADFKVTPNDSLFAINNSDVKVPYAYISKGKLDPAVDSVIFNYPAGSFYGPKFSGNSYKLIKVIGTRFSPDSVKASHILIDPSKVGGEANALKMADSLKAVVQKGGSFAELAKKYSVDGSKDKGGDLGTFGRNAMVAPFEEAAFGGRTGDLKVVKTQFGVHLIKIEKQIGSSKEAKLAYIEKTLAPSAKTRDIAYKKASSFLNEVKGDNFNALAQKQGYTVGVADKVVSSQGFAPGLDNPRQLIRDAYDAKKGDVLGQVYTMDNGFVVAHLTDIKPKGQLSLEDVKKQIQPMVMNAVKAKMLTEQANKALAGASSIDQVAQKLGKTATPVQNMVFANPIIPGLAQENKVVGTIFGSAVNKLSKPVDGEKGVYVFTVEGFTAPAPLGNTFKQKETMMLGVGQRSLGAAFQALQEKSDIKDNRVKFY
ncbi:SurA N-terminal domain-containing protein [Pedobacter sp. KR3-3]|uniref:Periplasmic chaperone PpiD n=1 Tax=Pedobacter albus TaxID=3113905 RepID=A0ABU7IBV7_9SPHI|nr:SurA N-terminal domain-containing protein [Pedobacter sp. KR3-3]MEE1946834.1 SurA N-terminal domain-containing protein [Pedobacter sp. KR3-3]